MVRAQYWAARRRPPQPVPGERDGHKRRRRERSDTHRHLLRLIRVDWTEPSRASVLLPERMRFSICRRYAPGQLGKPPTNSGSSPLTCANESRMIYGAGSTRCVVGAQLRPRTQCYAVPCSEGWPRSPPPNADSNRHRYDAGFAPDPQPTDTAHHARSTSARSPRHCARPAVAGPHQPVGRPTSAGRPRDARSGAGIDRLSTSRDGGAWSEARAVVPGVDR
jgi:hypothetical protein